MPIGDLTTLATVKGWRSPALSTVADDYALRREITACSNFIINSILNRKLVTKVYTENRNGNGQCSLVLFNQPIVSISSVKVNNCLIPAAVDQVACGYTFDSAQGLLYLRGYGFYWGQQNVQIVYTAGLFVGQEAHTLASQTALPCTSLSSLWSADNGVSYASGTPLVAVAATPAVGQYVAPSSPDGSYSFNTTDQSASLLFNYSYTPRDIEAACVTTIISEYNRRSRIGEDSKSLAAETIAYSKDGIPKSAMDMLKNYISVAPVMP